MIWKNSFPVLVCSEIYIVFMPNFRFRAFPPSSLPVFIMAIDGELNVYSTAPNSSGILHVTSFHVVSPPRTWYSASVQPSVKFEFSHCVPWLQSSQKLMADNKLEILFSLEYSSKLLHLTDSAGSLIFVNAELINWQREGSHGLLLKSPLEISVRLQSISAEGEKKPTQNPFLESLELQQK